MLKKLSTPCQCEVQSPTKRCQHTAYWQFWFQAVCDECIIGSSSYPALAQQFAEALADIEQRQRAEDDRHYMEHFYEGGDGNDIGPMDGPKG